MNIEFRARLGIPPPDSPFNATVGKDLKLFWLLVKITVSGMVIIIDKPRGNESDSDDNNDNEMSIYH